MIRSRYAALSAGAILVLFLGGIFLHRQATASSSPPSTLANFQLVLQGPFVVCEESAANDLLILVPDPKGVANQHADPGLSTALFDLKFTKGVNYEVKYLHTGNMKLANSDAELVQFPGTCPQDGYYVSVKVPKPDEI